MANLVFSARWQSASNLTPKKQLTERFPELREIGKDIKATEAILDGEIVALDRNGLPPSMACAHVVIVNAR